jgi:outer membrane protein TolC
LLSAFIALPGCAIWGPNYEKPQLETPEDWKSKDHLARIDGVPLPEMAWWDRFKDPVLNDLIQRALVQNNSVQAALGNIFQAKGILHQIEMRWVPRVDGGAGYISVNDTNMVTGAKLPFNSGFTAGFIPNYSINILQQLRTQEQAQANLAATRAAKNAVRLGIISQITGSYFSLREEQYRLALQKSLVEALDEIVKKYTEAHKEGLISAFALRQYSLQLADARAEIPVIQYNIVRLGNTIHLLLNENPGPVAEGQGFMALPYKSIISGNLPSFQCEHRREYVLLFPDHQLDDARGSELAGALNLVHQSRKLLAVSGRSQHAHREFGPVRGHRIGERPVLHRLLQLSANGSWGFRLR